MSEPRRTKAQRSERMILALVALFLPTASLIPLGGLYLWKEGYVLWWAAAALSTVGVVSLIEWWKFRRKGPLEAGVPVLAADGTTEPAATIEERAWRSVREIERGIDIDKLDSAKALGDLASRIVRAVAKHYHPEANDAIWRFTIPQALAISEQVARRLRVTVNETVPFGNRLTLAQVLAAYRFRGAVDVAEKLYDVWRIVRLVNPAAAATNEARERLSRAALNWGREHVTRRLTSAYVEEVGRAAIDLYSGRLAVPQPDQSSDETTAADSAEAVVTKHEKPPSALRASWSLAKFLVRRKKTDEAKTSN